MSSLSISIYLSLSIYILQIYMIQIHPPCADIYLYIFEDLKRREVGKGQEHTRSKAAIGYLACTPYGQECKKPHLSLTFQALWRSFYFVQENMYIYIYIYISEFARPILAIGHLNPKHELTISSREGEREREGESISWSFFSCLLLPASLIEASLL